jgi:hypothetical protein
MSNLEASQEGLRHVYLGLRLSAAYCPPGHLLEIDCFGVRAQKDALVTELIAEVAQTGLSAADRGWVLMAGVMLHHMMAIPDLSQIPEHLHDEARRVVGHLVDFFGIRKYPYRFQWLVEAMGELPMSLQLEPCVELEAVLEYGTRISFADRLFRAVYAKERSYRF